MAPVPVGGSHLSELSELLDIAVFGGSQLSELSELLDITVFGGSQQISNYDARAWAGETRVNSNNSANSEFFHQKMAPKPRRFQQFQQFQQISNYGACARAP